MKKAAELKSMVREKYSEIALQDKATNETSCCGSGTSTGTYTIMSDSYAQLPGYNADADLGLGCGLPTQYAQIQLGDTVLDLGSGAGNDCFVARAETGPGGKVIGVDFTPVMVQRARENAEKKGFNNIEFRRGDIEDLPVSSETIDVVVSNCVLNLVPDKAKVFAEIMRVLRPGGHFSISDIVLIGELPDSLRNAAEMYAGCVSGAISLEEYLDLAQSAGFTDLVVQKQKPILIPDQILMDYMTAAELEAFVASGTGIVSITVFAKKAGGEARKTAFDIVETTEKNACCTPIAGSSCCN